MYIMYKIHIIKQCLNYRSCGRKVSVGQYFERKSDDIEMLGNNEKIRPSFVLDTPAKIGKLPALIESTVLTDGNYIVFN